MLIEQKSIREKVCELIANLANMPVEEVKPYHLLNDELGIDSIRILELLSDMEDTFPLEIEVDDIQPEHFSSVESVIRFVEGKLFP